MDRETTTPRASLEALTPRATLAVSLSVITIVLTFLAVGCAIWGAVLLMVWFTQQVL
jgi:hypothetical protein